MVVVVLKLVQTKQTTIIIHKRNNTEKHSTNNTKHSKHRRTGYQDNHTLPKHPQVTKTPTHY